MGKLFCKMSDLHEMKTFAFQNIMKNSSTISGHYFMMTSSVTKKHWSVKTREEVGSQIGFSGLLMQCGVMSTAFET